MPFELGTITYPVRPPEWSMLVVAKGTFDLVHGANATIARPQRSLSGDTFFDDEADQSPVYPSDFAIVKQRGECFLLGKCRPPGKGATVSVAAFQVGAIQKAVGVFGDRRWRRGLLGLAPTDPAMFSEMPLRWDRSFGGPQVGANPVGRGVSELVDADGERFRPLPNLESMLDPIGGPDDRPEPAGFGPIAAHWAARWKLAGTYGDRWLKLRAPYLPEDMHPAFFNQAPADQRVRKHWAGNEEIVLKNVHPERELFRSRLPALRVRVFTERGVDAGGRFSEVKMTLDTVVVDGDAGQVMCVWRGLVPVKDAQASDVGRLFAFHEPFDVQSSFDACRDRLAANLLLMQLEDAGFRPRNPQEDMEAGTVALTRFARQQELDDDESMDGATMALTQMLVRQTTSKDTVILDSPDIAVAGEDAAAPVPEVAEIGEAAPDEVEELEDDPAWLALEEKLAAIQASQGDAPLPELSEEAIEAEARLNGFELPTEEANAPEPPPVDPVPSPRPVDPRQRVVDAHAAGEAIVGDFSGVDLSGLSLPGLSAANAQLGGANLSGTNLEGAVFDDALLFDANFDGANLTSASFRRTDLSRSSLKGVVLRSAVLDEAIAGDADFEGADLEDATTRDAVLRGACLRAVRAHRAVLDGADLTGAVLVDAKIRLASLKQTAIHGADASNVDLRGSSLEGFRCVGANLTRADLRESKADGAVFRESNLSEALLSFSKLEAADFSNCVMPGAVLDGCSLQKALFLEANLEGAEIIRADLSHAVFVGANLAGADLRGSCLYGAQAWRANLVGLNLAEALLDASSFAIR